MEFFLTYRIILCTKHVQDCIRFFFCLYNYYKKLDIHDDIILVFGVIIITSIGEEVKIYSLINYCHSLFFNNLCKDSSSNFFFFTFDTEDAN